ncbi:hypothetical protein VN21_08695 [Paraclostridium benzoelyticum]|uniref:ABC transporter domain-containing protein n=1 Tax=Paraclostridium benzoelyticum TaxID=1629550 RepID=A0A0M3DJ86_9FIRM|nr:ABC transporter ATP-binding protein [Paraclostridium benzoelyticum]KKY01494.1 hypothetical protein VN21_08695 [Paraclostridium benzoelyticum]
MLVLKNIVKKIGEREVLKNINSEFQGGINFILGPSGSGKSTLLKIIGGMDKEFDGDVVYKENSVKNFKQDKLNDYYYNSIGFIWQNFQLLNHLTVEENVKIVLELSNLTNKDKDKKVKKILSKLGIDKLANHKVANLSGGQKQRVAIARALVKSPEIIIADEPTGSLDKKSTKTIMDILRKIAKDKVVIIVTHDKSLVGNEDNCFYLHNGILEKVQKGKNNQEGENNQYSTVKAQKRKPYLRLSNAICQGITNFKGLAFKFVLTAVILAVSSYLLTLNIGGSVADKQSDATTKFGDTFSNEELKRINFYTVGFGQNGVRPGQSQVAEDDTNNDDNNGRLIKASEKFVKDPRVDNIVFDISLLNSSISINGETINTGGSDDSQESLGRMDLGKDLYKGRMPKPGKKEILIPKGIKNAESLIGKKVSIKGSILTRVSTGRDNPSEFEDVEIKDAEVVGVIDNSGQDTYIFNVDTYKELCAKVKPGLPNGILTAKEITDVLQLADELTEEGVDVIGAFANLEDMSIFEGKTQDQSSSVLNIISILAVAVSLIITIISSYLRKLEYSIFRINGYSKSSVFKLSIVEYGIISIIAIPITIVISLVMGTENTTLIIGILLLQCTIMGIISGIISGNTNVVENLTLGDRK